MRAHLPALAWRARYSVQTAFMWALMIERARGRSMSVRNQVVTGMARQIGLGEGGQDDRQGGDRDQPRIIAA
ncbi:hypothetical protein [Microtetraspora malaysiensis]|uniref:Uncharacterized protein n=1 Tax=Microtetraspora malaysiensis TaxID=161358 RepID=A0ABW6SXK5_9ACTN